MKGHNIFTEIFKEQANIFLNSFKSHSKIFFFNPEKKNGLHHSGEFGIYREKIVRDFIKLFVPQRLEIDSGFVIGINEKPTKQVDIVIYDKNETPLIKTEEGQLFFPIETVACVGEVKSDLGKAQLKRELINLVQFKKMRETIKEGFILYSKMPLHIKETSNGDFITKNHLFNPEKIWCDQITTFLICNKFTFKLDENNIDKIINDLYPKNTKPRHRIDFILSLEDGFIGYYNEEKKAFEFFPNFDSNPNIPNLKMDILFPKENKYDHLKAFASTLNNRLSFTTIIKPEIQAYIKEL